jgi:outer membrane protein insertion porin family
VIPHDDQPLVDLIFDIRQGSKVYFERINILGNTKTRDKVIRRELRTVEGELYSLTALKKSRDNLNYLGFFKEVDVSTKKGSADDKMVLNVRVEEGPTGSVSTGVGYSSIDKLVALLSISQNNLFGRGQRLVLSGQIGAVSSYYNLSFTEPRLFDTEILVGGDIYNTFRGHPFRIPPLCGYSAVHPVFVRNCGHLQHQGNRLGYHQGPEGGFDHQQHLPGPPAGYPGSPV